MPRYIGIVDALGLESFIPYEKAKNQMVGISWRARANTQRNAVAYDIELNELTEKVIKKLIKNRFWLPAG